MKKEKQSDLRKLKGSPVWPVLVMLFGPILLVAVVLAGMIIHLIYNLL